jgi:hypothetical protein
MAKELAEIQQKGKLARLKEVAEEQKLCGI